MSNVYDVAVVGGGVVGAAIARLIAGTRLTCVLVEAAGDIGVGTSKANTAILHSGFDAKPGTLEARLVRRGHELLTQYAGETGIPLEPVGALLIAWDEAQDARLPDLAALAARNGCRSARLISGKDLRALEPGLGPEARAAVTIPDEHIVCPFTTPLALATEAVMNGVTLALESPLLRVVAEPGVHVLRTARGTFRSRWVVNAAGLHADAVDRMLGHETFTVVPRRGELLVFDKLARPLVNHILLPVPTPVSKGVLIAPTVFGNVVLGPTAEDVDDKNATATTAAGMAALLEHGRRILPALMAEEVTATYAGLRAATADGDYQIITHADQRYVCVGGIRSTGLTAALAIAEYVGEQLAAAGVNLAPRDDLRRVRMPNLGETGMRPYQDAACIAGDPEFGRIVCHCERVTRGEIRAACHAPIPARSLDGVRRRTRALFGRCQGFYCAAEVATLVAEETGRSVPALLGLERA